MWDPLPLPRFFRSPLPHSSSALHADQSEASKTARMHQFLAQPDEPVWHFHVDGVSLVDVTSQAAVQGAPLYTAGKRFFKISAWYATCGIRGQAAALGR